MSTNGHSHNQDDGDDHQPFAPFRDGRDSKGKFALGNAGGPGNPNARRTAEIRQALLEAVTPDDIRAAARALVELAKQGDVRAFAELLDRTIGKAVAMDLEERMSRLEELIAARLQSEAP